jgi:antitoxin component HigA of HigAB toxin-antitoxin module
MQRKLTSIEDLFETQRKELFASMSELEKVMSKKQENIVRAIKEITQELNITNPLLIY